MSDGQGLVMELLLGGEVAVVSKSVTSPIERVKLLVQTQDELLNSGRLREPYKGYIDCALRTYRTEGISLFWRGNVVRCLLYFPKMILNKTFKDALKPLFKINEFDSYGTGYYKNIAGGGLAGILTNVLLYSLDYAVIRLTTDVKFEPAEEYHFSGIVDVYRKTLKSDGVIGLYRGVLLSCIGIIWYRTCYFACYDRLKPILLRESGDFVSRFALAYLSTLFAGIFSYPFDTVRIRMIVRSGGNTKYNGYLKGFSEIVKREGFTSLFKGVKAYILYGIVGTFIVAGVSKWHRFLFSN